MYTDKEILLAAQIAYYNFDPNVIAKLTEQNQGVPPTIQQLLQNDYNTGNNRIYYQLDEILVNAAEDSGEDSLEYERAQAAIKRYEDILSGELASGWRLADYRNENNTTGMAGCLLDTGNGSAIVGFRGSESEDAAQILFDWIISDLGLLNAYETVQHKAAENYMDYINERFGGKYNNFATSGHSLGGNLSFHATITAPPRLRNKITQSYSLDGPGYSNEYSLLHAKEIASLAPGVLQHRGWSAVGALLFPLRNTKYVQVQVPDELSGAGLQKHDTCFPMFDGDNFMLTDKQDILAIGLSAFSKSMDLGSGFFLPPICVVQKILEQQFEEQAKAKADQKLEEYLKEHEFENEQEIADFLKEKTGKEKPEYLVRGALLRCRCGTHARRMNLLKCHGVYVVSHPLVHELNCIVDDTDNNIASFGVCESPAPPPSESVSYTKDVIRDASGMEVSPAPGGFVTGHKCDPIIVNARWMDTHPPTRIVDNGHINSADRAIANSDGDEQPKGEASITTLSFLVCQYGGLIEPYNSGQEYEATENDIAKEEDGAQGESQDETQGEAGSEAVCKDCDEGSNPHGHHSEEAIKKEEEKRLEDLRIVVKEFIQKYFGDSTGNYNNAINALKIDEETDVGKLLAWFILLDTGITKEIINQKIAAGDYEKFGIGKDSNVNLDDSIERIKEDAAKIPPCEPVKKGTNEHTWYKEDINGKYGQLWKHAGTDFTFKGTALPVYATTSGFVVKMKKDYPGNSADSGLKDPGNYVNIQDINGNTHIYAHLSTAYVDVDTFVLAGKCIGTTGDTGNSKGEHLHYEIQGPNGTWGGANGNWGNVPNSLDPNLFLP